VIPYLDLNDTLANLIGDMLGGQDGEPMEWEKDEEDITARKLSISGLLRAFSLSPGRFLCWLNQN
jgi:hypothetical protein